MKIDKLKDILKNKKNMTIAGTLMGVAVIVVAGSMLLHNKFDGESKVEDINKVVAVNQEETAKEEEKSDINIKEEEVAKNEEVKEEKKEETVEENKEVVSNDISSTSSSTSSNTSSNTSGNNSSSSSQGAVQQPTTPPVEPAPQPTPTPTPQPKPEPQPPVEAPKPVYPSVAEVQQRLISYGQSLGLKYDTSLVTEGWSKRATEQMWSSEMGNSADQQRLFNGFEYGSFAIVVTDLGDFCRMEIYAPWE